MPDPHVYPDPQIAPLALPAAMPAPNFTHIEQLAAPDPTTPFIAKTMFIRVAMSGAPATGTTTPIFSLKADTGDAVALTDQTQAIYHLPGTGIADYVADGVATAESNNVFRIKVTFNDAAGAFDWQLGIQNMDAATAREFTWVVSATLANTAQPWIDVQPTALIWDVLIGASADDSVTISNKGTGSFTITGAAPALPGAFTLGALPGLLNPNTSAPLTVTFKGPGAPPAPDGVIAANAIVGITPADSTAVVGSKHNKQLSVSAKTQALEVALLLDDSGSMGWDANGNPLSAGSNKSRWSELADAVDNFLGLLDFFGEGGGNFGIAAFPPPDPTKPQDFHVQNPGPINAANIAAAKTAMIGVGPNNGTPMGDGLNYILVTAPYFATDALSISANRRWLLLMSDGANNSGSHNPTDFIGAPLVDKKVTVFSIGYGIQGASDVDHPLLQHLAEGSYLPDGSSAQFRWADQDNITAIQVAGAFKDAIKAGLTQTWSPGDPPAVFHARQAEARHFALITRYDRRAAFVLNWNTPDPKRLRLELITPTCDLITPETAGKGPFKDVAFVGGQRSQMYLVSPSFLSNAADPTRPRYGTWTLRVTSPELTDSSAGLEHYDYDILVDSTLTMTVKLDRPVYHAGDPIGVSARLLAAGRPIKNAAVVLSTTAPQLSANNWLAGLTVPPELLERAQGLVHGDSTPILIKATGARLAEMKFPGGTRDTQVVMTDPGGIGTYQATVTDTSVPEKYTFYVTATGVTEDGIAFRREGRIVTSVLVQPDPAHIQIDPRFRATGVVDIRVTPRDRFGNVLWVNTTTAKGFDLIAKGGKFTGPLVNNLDGSYSRTLDFDPAAALEIALELDGKAAKQLVLPPMKGLRWVDRVAAFLPGAQAARGANQHADPNAVLGDVFAKAAGLFVSLGAGGKLVVAVTDAAIVAAGDNDVTVFVPTGLEPCAYRVEAYAPPIARSPASAPSGWVTLGTSTGVTQSFSLRKASVQAAAAIRIVDLSRRTRGIDLKPLVTPGASFDGVGVLKASSQIPWGLDWLRKFLANPPP